MPSLFDSKLSPVDRRILGDVWERHFCELAAEYGKEVTAHQIGRTNGAACSVRRDPAGALRKDLLPDVSFWGSPSEHYEVKHKNPTNRGSYGLEAYRLMALVRFATRVQQPVYYAIHDWQHAGAATSAEHTPNRIEDWFYADVHTLTLGHAYEDVLPSLIAGQITNDVLQYFWPTDVFRPLIELWTSARNGCCGIASDLPFCAMCGRWKPEA